MSPLPRPRALLLDLDGTLIDSAPDIARALAETLAAYGLPPLDEVAGRPRLGHGVARLAPKGLPAGGGPLAAGALAGGPAGMEAPPHAHARPPPQWNSRRQVLAGGEPDRQ